MPKLLAYYLPQFHPIPENDRWWGKGFTEWAQLHRWQPVHAEHQLLRPHTDIGEYDLRNKEVRKNQARLAYAAGLHGFCVYHYWMGDSQLLLEKPYELMLQDGEPNIPFCFMWCNEPWTRTWCGQEGAKEILIAQKYGEEEEWERHCQYLLQFWQHWNYIQVDGCPMLVIYKIDSIPAADLRLPYYR